MIIPFGGENDTCGVEFNTVSGTYWVEIEVHSNNTVETEFDRIFNVTCDNTIDQPKAEYILDLYPIPSNDNQRSTNIEHGKTYFLDAFMPSFDDETKYGNNFRITNCIIETVDDTNAIEIINSNGCSSDPKLISEIDYSNGYATTNISSINPYLKNAKN
uniref:Uncharacterized protein n=1 Tax=Panagrolaimus superbus TaxID=310955 RepID=A0A914Y3K0_9BILA